MGKLRNDDYDVLECSKKEFGELNGRIGNWVENESKSEVLSGEIWN